MVNASLFRLPSTELSAILRGKKIRLPHACLTLMGVEVAAQFGLADEKGQALIPERRYTDKFDPIKFLRYWPFNAEGICDQEVLLPRQVVTLHAAGQTAQDVTDQLSTAARDLLTAIAEYKVKFMVQQRMPDGQTQWVERPSTTTRQEEYKGVWRANIQKAFLNYQFRQLQELRRVLKKQVFQTVHPGCFAPLIPDPTLGIDQVRIPAEIWPAFAGQHALVLRHPVLEVVYRMKPVKGSDMAIGLNPLLYDKIGADCDGDSLFVTPIPNDLDGGKVSVNHEHIVYDEANVLLPMLPQGHAKCLPVDIPPLNLHDFGPESEFTKFVGQHKIRNFKNAVWEPMDEATYWQESLNAAGRFRWEKDSIGRADWIRRSLVVMTDDPQIVRSINRFCGSVSQKAIDAGKHRENFPLEAYMRCFNCRYEAMGGHGPYMAKFDNARDMAAMLVELTDLHEMMDDALTVSEMLFAWPEFREIGMQGLIEHYFPWWAFMSIKRPSLPRSGRMMKEARILMNLDSSLAGQVNLYF